MEIALLVTFVAKFCIEMEVQLQPFHWWIYTHLIS